MYPKSMFRAKIRNIFKNSSENEHFYSREVCCILHGHGFVMESLVLFCEKMLRHVMAYNIQCTMNNVKKNNTLKQNVCNHVFFGVWVLAGNCLQ